LGRCLSTSREEQTATERPSLGISALERNDYSTGPLDKLRRIALVLVAIVLVGGVFYYLTRAVQTSTAHATNDESPLHSEP
jgi:hypothetical protein